ncbi:MAG: aldo/keto reductase [Spirochaetia bacterium]|jgi:aryl-alcohol dehydrogenase-like predicted oxidoreductase|nr:aldo/keto reductase [Spirochaetia bacterium]
MKYRKLGSTNLEVSVVGVGTWQFGGEWGRDFTQKDVSSILASALDNGINLIDTAECYGDHLSERLIGGYIKNSRDKWIVATKFGHHFHSFMERTRHFKPDEVVRQLDDSLKSLNTDYIDIYQMHSAKDDEFLTDNVWETLLREVEKGKIRHLGISITPNTNIYQVSKAKSLGAETVQVVYNRLDRKAEKEVFPQCEKDNLGVFARVPLASGILSGKYRSGHAFPDNDVRAVNAVDETAKNLVEAEKIRESEVPEGVSMASWALAWCLKNPVVTAVIPGSKSPDQVKLNAAASELVLK